MVQDHTDKETPKDTENIDDIETCNQFGNLTVQKPLGVSSEWEDMVIEPTPAQSPPLKKGKKTPKK